MENIHFRYQDSIRGSHNRANENNFDPDEGNERFCGACMLPIFSTPYEIWGDGGAGAAATCDVRHKCCFKQVVEALTDHPLHPNGALILHKKLPSGERNGVRCDNCLEECKSFFYQCPDKECRYTLDVKCATTVKVVHRSHKHELTFIPKTQESRTCAACGLQQQGLFYGCDFCQFYLHRRCALLANVILHQSHENMQHPLALTFSIPEASFKYLRSNECSICKQKLSSIKSGAYFCTKCDHAIHVHCVISSSVNVSPVSCDIAKGLPHFPMKNEDRSLMLYLQEQESDSGTIEEEKKLKNKKIHDHELVLCEKHCAEPTQLSHLCEACLEPVSPPFYTCFQCNDFYLHRCCANLSLQIHHPSHCLSTGKYDNEKPFMHLVVPRLSSNNFSSGSLCGGCFRYNNGFYYECRECEHRLDVRCAHFPTTITYELHGKSHILFLSYGGGGSFVCPCCGHSIGALFYECSTCPNFKIDAHCALLPTSVSHKYDRHKLQLTSSEPGSTPKDSNDDVDFCEICEERMVTNQWFYHCKQCMTSFHINCIPCVGESSKIKPERTISVKCHNCPLTCIHMLINYSYTCSHCQETIQGKEDAIAFECSKCSFWLHKWCARYHQVADTLTQIE